MPNTITPQSAATSGAASTSDTLEAMKAMTEESNRMMLVQGQLMQSQKLAEGTSKFIKGMGEAATKNTPN